MKKYLLMMLPLMVSCKPISAAKEFSECESLEKSKQVAYERLYQGIPDDVDIRLEDVQEDTALFEFYFEGTGEFARPGYHWLVTVKKVSCETDIRAGM